MKSLDVSMSESPKCMLVTGCYGQLGSELRRILETGVAEIGPVEGYQNTEVDFCDIDTLDICDVDALRALFDARRYDLVINCAAMTNVDGCEVQKDLAFKVNALGPENLARACARYGAKLVHISTDYVFSGTERGERTESDVPSPISMYGKTKLEGEIRAISANPATFIVRTAWLYGYVGKNFVKTMLRLAKAGAHIMVVDDQIGNPTSANDLAYEILHIAKTHNYGIYHCTSKGICSWFEFARSIMEYSGFDPNIVSPCTSLEYAKNHPEAASRPAFSALANKHLQETIGDSMRFWKDALSNYFLNYDELEG